MKRLFRYFLILVLLLIVVAGVAFFVLNKKLPEGKEGPAAEQLTDKMLAAVNIDAWNQIKFLEWDFPRGHHHFWDRTRDLAEVKWDDHRVLLNFYTKRGIAYANGKRVEGDATKVLVEKAFHLFWNDSFWLMGFTKVRDPGTTRKLVTLDDGEEALLVTYGSGGTTPGDSYLWLLDESGRPYAWRMWVDLIPIGGLEFTWEDWQPLPNGALMAPTHKSPFFSVDMFNVKVGDTYEDMGRELFIFDEILVK